MSHTRWLKVPVLFSDKYWPTVTVTNDFSLYDVLTAKDGATDFHVSCLSFLITGCRTHATSATSTEPRNVQGFIRGWLFLRDMPPASMELGSPDVMLPFHLHPFELCPRTRPTPSSFPASLCSYDLSSHCLPRLLRIVSSQPLLSWCGSLCPQLLHINQQENNFRCIPVQPRNRGLGSFVTGSHQPMWAEGTGWELWASTSLGFEILHPPSRTNDLQKEITLSSGELKGPSQASAGDSWSIAMCLVCPLVCAYMTLLWKT